MRNAHQIVPLLRQLALDALVETGLSEPDAVVRFDRELDYYRALRVEHHSIPELFERVVISLGNRERLYGVIFGGGSGYNATLAAYREVLFDFNPQQVSATFGPDLEGLIGRLVEARGFTGPQADRQLTNSKASFRIFARGIQEAAGTFGAYRDVGEFCTLIEHHRAAGREGIVRLPYEFRFTGFSYALAADFLKEVGLNELGKPDVHVRRAFGTLGWCDESAAPEMVQGVLWDWGQEVGLEPVILDKHVFFVGSGRFDMVEPVIRCRPQFNRFVERVVK